MDCSNLRHETERLALVSMDSKFREAFFVAFRPDVATYMYPRAAEDISETDASIAHAVEQNLNGIDLWTAITLKESGEFLGEAILFRIDTPTPEFGIWIKSSAQGKGLGREAVAGLIAWARENLAIEYFTYPVVRQNLPSRKVAEHFGGEVRKEYTAPNQDGLELDLVEYWIV